jgi:SAM-dependent methyltransferase
MRVIQWQWFAQAFEPAARLLELGSGTGLEAARLAESGRKVALLDVSSQMLEKAAARVNAAAPESLLGQHCLAAAQVGQLATIYARGSFDGVYSSFGPLNCEPDLSAVAAGLAPLVRTGGSLVFSVMPKLCLTEIAWFGLHGEFKSASRRLRGPILARALPGEELLVKTFYYNPSAFRRAFQPYFKMVRVRPLPLLWPPPYLAHLPRRFPRFFGGLKQADNWVSNHGAVLAIFGDHFLIQLERI